MKEIDKEEWRMMYAGMAMQGMIANGPPFSGETPKEKRDIIARVAFAIADVMLEAATK